MTFSIYSVAQIIGFIAMICGIAACLHREDHKLKILMVAQGALLTIHFILLGAFTGAAGVCLAAIRAKLSMSPSNKRFAPLFYGMALILGILTYNSPVDILPVLANIIGTTAFFYAQDTKMRFLLLGGSITWLCHNLIVGSIGPSVMEAFISASLCYAIIQRLRTSKASPE